MGDIQSNEMEMELNRFAFILTHDKSLLHAKDFLNHIYKHDLQELYPNMAIALRVLLTTPVTVASAESSFSRMKIIMNVLRSTMSDERLSDLGIISIESNIARSLDYNHLVKQFAHNKASRKPF